jgi:hypothetical protein
VDTTHFVLTPYHPRAIIFRHPLLQTDLISESVIATTRTALISQAALLEAEEQKFVSELSVVRALLKRTRVGVNELLNRNVPIMSVPNEMLGEIFQTYYAQAQI